MKEIDYSKYFWKNDKVRLRPLKIEDWKDRYYNIFDSDARFFLNSEIDLPVDEKTAEDDFKKRYGNGNEKNKIDLLIETLEGISVGSMHLGGINERNGTFGIGMQINIEHRGKGYGTAAMKILLDYCFNERRLNKYQSFVIEGNVASEKMLQKLGCIKEGVIRGTTFHQGKYWNEIHYGLFAKEFNEKNKKSNGHFA
jgi:RimJ/RimL family protein N-acetyltransferase